MINHAKYLLWLSQALQLPIFDPFWQIGHPSFESMFVLCHGQEDDWNLRAGLNSHISRFWSTSWILIVSMVGHTRHAMLIRWMNGPGVQPATCVELKSTMNVSCVCVNKCNILILSCVIMYTVCIYIYYISFIYIYIYILYIYIYNIIYIYILYYIYMYWYYSPSSCLCSWCCHFVSEAGEKSAGERGDKKNRAGRQCFRGTRPTQFTSIHYTWTNRRK